MKERNIVNVPAARRGLFKYRQLLMRFVFVIGLWVIPFRWCSLDANKWYQGDELFQARLARSVEHWMETSLSRGTFPTGSKQFNGEWLFGTFQMAALGFGQTALEHPELRSAHLRLMEECEEKLLAAKVKAFDQEAWNEDPLELLSGENGHAAYLGYMNLVLSLHRLLDPNSKHRELNDQITTALVRRLNQNSRLLLQTYPHEIYPVDNAAVIASIALYDRATGTNHLDLIQRWSKTCRERYVDSRTGLLIQAINETDGSPLDEPRGSGTLLASYFLGLADLPLARELYDAAKRELAGTILGFGVIREYPRSSKGRGDIDSGPILFGKSISATGFMLACARQQRDRKTYESIFATAHLFGAPTTRNNRTTFVAGGPLGDAMMFALLTAIPPGSSLKRL